MSVVHSPLYWTLPTPSAFLSKLRDAVQQRRVVLLNFPEVLCVNPRRVIENALADAGLRDPIVLDIADGVSVAGEIGTHFSEPIMTAELLAHQVCGYPRAVVLHAKGAKAQISCENYAQQFIAGMDHSSGDVRLIMALCDGTLHKDQNNDTMQVISFDGYLTPSEMHAYVYQRMVSRDGPGSTSLLRSLVAEYASFDPLLAERLVQMEAESLLGLPDSLTHILSSDPLRWSRHGWIHGTTCQFSDEVHALYEWYQATHSSRQASQYRKRSEKRYWRACIKTLLPWLEERRPLIIEALKRPIDRIEDDSGRRDNITKMMGKLEVQVTRDELEYNDIVYRSYTPAFTGIEWTPKEAAAVTICRIAKKVRDDLSHLRCPQVEEVLNLVTTMDQLLPKV